MDLSTLNPQQLEAVQATEGPLLILAGAGSGKTKVLTYRIAYILEQGLARPEEVLAVTFTNKAAGEMKQRIAKLLGGSAHIPWMGTFHSICLKMLKRDGQVLGIDPNFSIYDPGDQQDVVKQAMEQLNISTKDVNPRAVHGHISSAKNELVGPEDYAKYATGYFQEIVAKVYPLYQQILRQNNALDFDDLLLYAVQLLKGDERVRQKYQQWFKYILVDEYQDTNNTQYVLINTLAELHRNVCCVGDDDQSIYSFRGANIRNILNFNRDYPDATIIKLEQNYRSTQKILEAAHAVVSKNKQRTDKKLWTQNGQGEKIVLYTAENERQEAEWVMQKIKQIHKAGTPLEDMVILYRTNAQSRAIEEVCVRMGVRYHIVGGVRFYERKEIKDILAYLRMLYNSADDNCLKRIINIPRRSIGAKALADLHAKAHTQGMSMTNFLKQAEAQEEIKAVAGFARLLQDLCEKAKSMPIVDFMEYLLERTEYIKMLEDGTLENESRIENIKELISVAAKYNDEPPEIGLALFLEEVSLLEGDVKDEDGGVTLMTIHAAKGLEFEYVFLVGVEEGLFPHSRVFTDPNELEEERRLAYVAITRAKKFLYMVHADSRLYFGTRQNNLLSRFADDIPPSLIERQFYDGSTGDWVDVDVDSDGWSEPAVVRPQLQVGDRVKHEYFGQGRVVKVDKVIVKIDFGGMYGVKELALEFAPLQKV